MPTADDAQDILQEVYVLALSRIGTLKNPESFKPWILKIASNKCGDFYRTRAQRLEIPLDEVSECTMTLSGRAISVRDTVRETLFALSEREREILYLYYIKEMAQAELAKRLNIPVGTVKSRLFNAKKSFRAAYPYPPKPKGENFMKRLPEIMPEYKITRTDKQPFEVKWEELPGWFIVPRLGEGLTWAMYDFPERKRSETVETRVVGRASVHGVDGVEIIASEQNPKDFNAAGCEKSVERSFVAQLTDTHCRFLAESHYERDVKKLCTFLDSDEFIPNWGFGEDNCGKETLTRVYNLIKRDGDIIVCPEIPQKVLDNVGRYNVELAGRNYDTVLIMDIEYYNCGVMAEAYVDENGRTVLWRRFNRDDWAVNRYKQRWSERFPENERVTINGETYVHWYDCLTDYIL